MYCQRSREGSPLTYSDIRIYKGRPASIEAVRVRAMKAQGMGATEIAKELGIGRASVYRVLKAIISNVPFR